MESALRYFDNYLNPLLLRELRQLVRNRYIIVLINLFIAVLVLTCVFTVLVVDRPQDRATGQGLFAALTGIMGFACFLTVVVYTSVVTATERINGDLMFASALKPSQIVLGKFYSGMILTFLLMSITLPFVTLAYLLRGLDFQMVLISFGMTFLMIQVMNALAIFIFSNVKTHVHTFVGIIASGFICITGFNIGVSLLVFGGGNDWTQFFSVALSLLALLGFFLALAVATVAPPTANRLLPLRIIVTSTLLLSLAYCCFIFAGSGDIFEGWTIFWSFALIPLLMLVVCERETWTYRVRKTIPGNFVLRMLAFPFYTGSPCGLVWIALLAGVIVFIGATICVTYQTRFFTDNVFGFFSDEVWKLILAWMFAFNYCVTALLLRSFLFPKVPTAKIWAIALALLMLGTFGSMLTFYLMEGDLFDASDRYSAHILSALNPFMLTDNYDQTLRFFAATAWTGLLMLPFLFWFALRIREFTPSPPSDMMSLEDAIAIVKHADENPMVKGKREN